LVITFIYNLYNQNLSHNETDYHNTHPKTMLYYTSCLLMPTIWWW